MAKEFTDKTTGNVYRLRNDGHVLVTAPDGTSGLFSSGGEWVEGELEFAEPVMCQFVGRAFPKDKPPPGVRTRH